MQTGDDIMYVFCIGLRIYFFLHTQTLINCFLINKDKSVILLIWSRWGDLIRNAGRSCCMDFFFQLQFPNGFMEICTFMRKLHPDLDRTTPEDRTLMTGVTSWRAQIAKFACLKVGRVHTWNRPRVYCVRHVCFLGKILKKNLCQNIYTKQINGSSEKFD